MRIYTTNYDDFRAMIKALFGDTAAVFFGLKPAPHQHEAMVIATDRNMMVVYTSNTGLPEEFNNNFINAKALAEIHRIELG